MFEKTRSRIVAVVAAGILVAALWPGLAAAQQAAQEKPQPQQQERPRIGRLAQELNVTPEQQKKLQDLHQAWRDEKNSYRDRMTKMRQDLRGRMADPKVNQAKIDGLYDQMARMRAEREKSMLKFRLDRESVFTADQLARIKELRGRIGGRGGFGRLGRFERFRTGGWGRGGFMGRDNFAGRGRFLEHRAWRWRMLRRGWGWC